MHTIALVISLSLDITHFEGEKALFVEAGPAIISNHGVGIDKQIFRKGEFQADFGVFRLYNTNSKMGTNWNFITTLRYGPVVMRHISHGSAFGIAPNKANAGYNFIGLEFNL